MIIELKNQAVGDLIYAINESEDLEFIRKSVFCLIDHFKDERIVPFLIHLASRKDLFHYNGYIIFACGEYSAEACKPYIDFFIEMVISGDYEASMSAAGVIARFPEPYDWDEEYLDRLSNKLLKALETENQNKVFIEETLQYFN